ncbi:hypothetical protein KFE25_003989 [Diacronema lutheri]|uniref:AB hydrolase-1 domain-containing protein n=1 Tax=Diacronema lutheri TaxID=2081491 RepID=A0A8J6CA53_DIALT|nr:hypothetical protein KFE25_003989 [Diacronema lutheri]
MRRAAPTRALALLSLASLAPGGLHAAAFASSRLGSLRTVALQTLEVASAEDAPPLVIVHGLFGSARNFLSFSTMLSQQLRVKRRILMVDLRNHGRSAHAPTMSYEEMAADVLALLDERGIRRAAVIGHSMGGKVSAVMALNQPELVQSLGILDIAPIQYTAATSPAWAEVEAVVRACAQLPLDGVRDRHQASRMLEASIPNPIMRAFVLTNLTPRAGNDASGWDWRINVQAIASSLAEVEDFPYPPDGSRQYAGQAFFIGGSDSTFIKTSHLPAIASFFPQYTVAKIKNAGHWIHTEQPAHTLELVSRFLDESAEL